VSALAGLRVLDLTRYIPGPYCTMLLADLGADVVKVEEPPVGDPTRAVPPPVGEDSALHAALNRNKRSVMLDLRQDEGALVVRRLAARADVFVEAFRPGTMGRRGLGYEDLRALNPRLVYCSLSGYGQEGPHAQRAGHDVNYVALSGFLGSNCDGDGHPVLPATQVADMTGGLVAALGILAALQARERTGQGQLVDVSLYQAALALMTIPMTRATAGGAAANELSGHYACYRVYACRDGKAVAVGALEPKFWANVCRVLELPHLVGRQWARGDVMREAIAMVARAFSLHDRDEWLRRFEGVEACVEPVLSLEDALAHPQAAAYRLDQPAGAALLQTIAPPLRLSATPVAQRREAPAPGQHNDEVLQEAGWMDTDIERLRTAGVLA
jgi:alpha-methylacyl-CoA racemase